MMSRDELLSLSLALIEERDTLRARIDDQAKHQEEELDHAASQYAVRIEQARRAAQTAEKKVDFWKTEYAFTCTLVTETLKEFVKEASKTSQGFDAIELFAGCMVKITNMHANKSIPARGGLQYWKTKTQALYNSLYPNQERMDV
jgi:hypothetical protein